MRSFSIALAVSLLFTGDILLDRGVRQVIEHHGADRLFSRSVDSVLRSADIVVGNLECPATTVKAPVYKRFIFRAEPEWLTVLRRHGFTHLNLANNHAIDQGREGLIDTRRNILKAGMTPVGAGATMQEAARAVLLTRQPRNVWLVASLRLPLENFAYLPLQPCVSQEPMDSLLCRVRRLRRNDPKAVIIVSLHWGAEHTLQPVPRQRLEAHRLVDAGADVLICHHTHTLQTVEDYRSPLSPLANAPTPPPHRIYYSIGNFIFDQHSPPNNQAAMVRLRVDRQTLDVETLPVTIRRCTPYLLSTKN